VDGREYRRVDCTVSTAGVAFGEATLRAAFRAHYAVVGLGVVAALSIRVSLFRRRSAPAERSTAGGPD